LTGLCRAQYGHLVADPLDVAGLLTFEPGETGWDLGNRHAYELAEGWLWVRYDEEVAFLPYGAWVIPASFEVVIEMPQQLPYTVSLRFSVTDDRPVCNSMTLEPERRYRAIFPTGDGGIGGWLYHPVRTELTSKGLREVPVGRLQRQAVLAAIHAPRGVGERPRPHRLEDWADIYAAQQDAPSRKPGDRLDDDHYRKVAEIYRQATRSPTAEVAKKLNASRSSAGRWVMVARQKGFLGETTRGKPGEVRRPPTGGVRDTKEQS
jgi:hypothetical protein